MNDVQYAEQEHALKIDKHALDDELIEQPQRYRDVSEAYALAISRRDMAKDELKTTEARLYVEIKRNNDKSGDKCTNDMLNALVQSNSKRATVAKAYFDAALEADKWEALQNAFDQRSFVLRSLVSLHLGSYFSESSASSPQARELQDREHDDRRRRLNELRNKSEHKKGGVERRQIKK